MIIYNRNKVATGPWGWGWTRVSMSLC